MANKRTEDLSQASSSPSRQSLEAEAEKLLGIMNAKVVMQVCGNFALKEEFGELTKEVNDSRAKEHHKIIEETLAALLKTVNRYVEERVIEELEDLYAQRELIVYGDQNECSVFMVVANRIKERMIALRQQVKGGKDNE